jgi:hypothetical protein
MILYNIYGNSNLNKLQQHVSAVKSHFRAEYKGVCIIQMQDNGRDLVDIKFEIVKRLLLK